MSVLFIEWADPCLIALAVTCLRSTYFWSRQSELLDKDAGNTLSLNLTLNPCRRYYKLV